MHRLRSVHLSFVCLVLGLYCFAPGFAKHVTSSTTAFQSQIVTVSAANYAAPVAPDSIVAGFGSGLAPQTEVAGDADPQMPGVQLPTELAGVSLEVNGVKASLFFVSPGQINYLIPPMTAAGNATVAVKSGMTTLASGTIEISATAPSLFTANSNGQGVPAAYVLRIKPDGAQITEAVEQFSTIQNRFTPRPFSLDPEGDILVLVLFGTGLRKGAAETIRASIDNQPAQTFFAAHPVFIGLDQTNVILPRTLLGKGFHRVKVASGEKTSNEVDFEITLPNGAVPPPPTANFDSIVLDEDAGKPLTLSGTDSEGRPLFFTVTSQPMQGAISGSSPNFEYRPRLNYNGVDSFSFKANNGLSDSVEATVSLLIRPVNDPPTASFSGPGTVMTGEQHTLTINGSDIDGNQGIRCEPVDLPDGAIFTQSGPTTWQMRWTPTFLRAGANRLRFRLTDDGSPPQSAISEFALRVETQPLPLTPLSGTRGESGGDVRAIYVGSDYLVINAGSSIFRSTNNGGFWRLVQRLDATVTAIAGSGTTVIAAANRALQISTNNGARWAALPEFPGPQVIALSAVGSSFFAGSSDSVYRSADGGQSWTKIGMGLAENAQYRSFGVIGTTLYTGTANGQIYRTDNGGETWTGISQTLVNAGGIQALLAFDQTIIAGTTTGIYRTTNGGQNWTRVFPAQNSVGCSSLAMSGARLYAATDGGLIVSTSQGQNWAPANAGSNSYRAVAASGPALFAADGRGFYLSTDNGQTLNESVDGIFSGSVEPMNTVFIDGSTLYVASTNAGRIYRSTDFGRTWETWLERGKEIRVTFSGGNSTYISPLIGYLQFIKVGEAIFLADGSALLRYTRVDGIDQWAFLGELNNNFTTSLTTDGQKICVGDVGRIQCFNSAGEPTASYALPAELFPTLGTCYPFFITLLGDKIFFAHSFIPPPTTVGPRAIYRLNPDGSLKRLEQATTRPAQIIAKDGILFASETTRIFTSTDEGETWTLKATGIVYPVVIGSNIYAYRTATREIVVSRDNGETWTTIANTGGTFSPPYFLTQLLHTSTTRVFLASTNGVSEITVANQIWSATNTGLTNTRVNAVAQSGNTLYAGTLGGGVFRSPDSTPNWTAVNTGLPSSVNIQSIAANAQTVFAATFGDGVYRSTDGGNTWAASNTGLPNPFVNAVTIIDSTVFALTENGLFRSSNNGSTWTASNTGLPRGAVTALISQGGALYLGTEIGVYRSTDNGQSWAAFTSGLTRRIRSLGVGVDGLTLFAGTSGAGVFRSTNGGQSWTAVNNQMPNRSFVTAFVVARGRLFAGTTNGVFATSDNGATWEQINAGMTDIFVTALVGSGDRLFAGFATGGVFLSEIPQ